MHPVLFSIGSLEIGAYGILLVLGIVVGLSVAAWLGKRDGLPVKKMNDVGVFTLLGGALGAKALDTLVQSLGNGSLSITGAREAGAVHGGLIVGGLTLVVVARWKELPLLPVFDAHIPAIAFAQALGRIGCFLAGCCFGAATDGTFGVTYTSEVAHRLSGTPLGSALHPVQLYDAALHFVLGGVFLFLHRKALLRGRLFGFYLIAEGVVRFSLEALRGDAGRGVWAIGFSTGRLTALLFLAVGILAVVLLPKRDPDSSAAYRGDHLR